MTIPGRQLAVVPDPVPDPSTAGPPDLSRLPLITLDALPGELHPGDSTELLVMAANPQPETLREAWLGLVFPPGVEVSSVTPPAGLVAVTERSGDGEVVRTRLSELTPGSCVGLEVGVTLPDGVGPHQVTAFVTPCDEAEISLTCSHVLESVNPRPRRFGRLRCHSR